MSNGIISSHVCIIGQLIVCVCSNGEHTFSQLINGDLGRKVWQCSLRKRLLLLRIVRRADIVIRNFHVVCLYVNDFSSSFSRNSITIDISLFGNEPKSASYSALVCGRQKTSSSSDSTCLIA